MYFGVRFLLKAEIFGEKNYCPLCVSKLLYILSKTRVLFFFSNSFYSYREIKSCNLA
jgi:hypothetical protein